MIRIEHITFDLTAPYEGFAQQLYSGWEGFYRHCLERVLEEALAPYGEDKVVREIEQLNLDLGKIPEDDFYKEFPRRLKEEVGKALATILIAMPDTCASQTPVRRIDNFLFHLQHGYPLPGWADEGHDLQADTEWLTSLSSANYNDTVKKLAAMSLHQENVLRRLLWQTHNEKLLADIFSAAINQSYTVQDKKRFFVLVLETRPDIALGFVHDTQDNDSLQCVSQLLDSPSVAVIMRTETASHAEVDLPPYWHYLYEWLIRHYPYKGVAMFGGKAQFTSHLHFRLLTFIKKRQYSFYLSKAELTVDFLLEVFGQAYYIDVLNAIYDLQPHNDDGSPIHDSYFNQELYRTFLKLSLLRLPANESTNESREQLGASAAMFDKETSPWNESDDIIEWVTGSSVPEKHRREVVRMAVLKRTDKWIDAFRKLPTEGNSMNIVASYLSPSILLQGVANMNFYQATVLERTITLIRINAEKYRFLSHSGTALQGLLSKALLLYMRDEDTLGRTLTESEILHRFLKHLYSVNTGRTDDEGFAAWQQIATDVGAGIGADAPETSKTQQEELPQSPVELLEHIRHSVAQNKLTIKQWAERLGTAYWKWLAANHSLSVSDHLQHVIEAMQVDEKTERTVWATCLINDKGKALQYNTFKENALIFVETICDLQGKDKNKEKTEAGIWNVKDVVAPAEYKVMEAEVINVDNVGLCLLAPWFVRLFDILGYLDDDRKIFKETSKKVRAVFLLQYIAYGEEKEWREPDLAFNRLLTALPEYIPLPRNLSLTTEELQTADSMVQGVKANWPKMNGTSVAGFRNSFIIRHGILEEEENHWTLTVEEKPYDMLLDTVPWGFRQIRLPWLKKYVQVLWHEKQGFN